MQIVFLYFYLNNCTLTFVKSVFVMLVIIMKLIHGNPTCSQNPIVYEQPQHQSDQKNI
jgi:hypothetical protein